MAILRLLKLLQDTRPAPVWGSEGAVEQQAYGYRVADYALTVMTSVNAQPVSVPKEPKARDKLIQQLLSTPTP